MSVPTEVRIEIEEKDLQQDAAQIMETMSALRTAAKQGKPKKSDEDEYLHLTYRLASILENMDVTNDLQTIIAETNANPLLMQYDVQQDLMWRNRNPVFSKTLDTILVHVTRDRLRSIEDKHHIFQAVKYLGVADADNEERLKVYDTILARNNVPLPSSAGTALTKVFGSTYQIIEDNGKELTLKGNPRFIDDAVRSVEGAGHLYADFVVGQHVAKKLIEKYPDWRIDNNQPARPLKHRRFWQGLVGYTKPIS